MDFVLGGYSYGSLVLARLPPIRTIIGRFESAEVGSAAAEIILRARTLSRQTNQATSHQVFPSTTKDPAVSSDRASPESSSRSRASPVTVGGEESDSSERRRSRDSRRSSDLVRNLPQRVKTRIRSASRNGQKALSDHQRSNSDMGASHSLAVHARYFLVSPVLLPMTDRLAPPGLPFAISRSSTPVRATPDSGSSMPMVDNPTLAIFGSKDSFTSGTRLQHWAARLETEAAGHFQWTQIDSAGHFWREPGVLRDLQTRLVDWIENETQT